jgi:hypothetical protein
VSGRAREFPSAPSRKIAAIQKGRFASREFMRIHLRRSDPETIDAVPTGRERSQIRKIYVREKNSLMF